MDENAPVIEVRDLVRSFGGRRVLDGLSFEVQRGETLVIMGGSGCGKSTVLRHLIGSLQPSSGVVRLFGEDIAAMDEEQLAPIRRRFGVLFQSGALLQSLTLAENIALPIVEHGNNLDANIVDLMVKMKLEMVGLTGFEHLKPGGNQWRNEEARGAGSGSGDRPRSCSSVTSPPRGWTRS
jgi:phospholipid/cholesterol/gamma-HCH transport system ATP-binding protein